MRVRMYRHGLGDCFLLTFPRAGQAPFQILIDCGALARDKTQMTALVKEIRDTVKEESGGKRARLDVVVGTHEHKDHLSGFNQARSTFNNDFDFGEVWLAWTEDLSQKEIKAIKDARREATKKVRAAISALSINANLSEALGPTSSLLQFSDEDDGIEERTVAAAFEYLKQRGRQRGSKLRFLKPGEEPRTLKNVNDVRVFVLGPPLDPILLKSSEVTEAMKRDGTIYHLAPSGLSGAEALAAAASAATDPGALKAQPFSSALSKMNFKEAPAYKKETWRRIDQDWMSAFGQLALDLDNDTNNSSLVLAFEFESTGEVLLFAADAQVGSWLSWRKLALKDGRNTIPALELLGRAVFYKVGHHCSHNATLKENGLELMQDDRLVAFIPLDVETARKQGTKGWDMPAKPLLKALKKHTGDKVVISDASVDDPLSAKARKAGVIATDTYIDYFLR
ncbi:MAG: hypothetical protein U1E25_13225 [Methylocystis sp.]